MGGKTQQTTQQVQIPPSVLARYNSVNATAQQVAQTPFQQYSTDPNAFVAPVNAQQTAGINATNQYANAAQPAIAGGEALTMAGAGPVNPTALDASAIQQYENPYTSYVTNQMSQLMNQQNQQAQAGQLGNAITSGGFGGDRSGIAAANLAGQQSLAYGNAMAPVLQQGYNTALGAAQQQQGVGLAAGQANAARLTQAGAQLGSLGQAGQSAGLAGAQAQTAAGTLQQQTTQAGDTALYNQFLQQQSYPFQTAQFLANIAEGTGALSGQTTTTTSPAPFFSDRRLKENIKKIGSAKNGLPIYSFNYKGDPEKLTRLGFMADEVEKKHPDAVGLAGGFKTVDYDAASRPKRYAGGLIADSDEGRGFDVGGAATPTDWASMLASHQGMYGPQAGGLYGGAGAPGSIPGGGKSYVPAASLPQHQMLQPGHAPAQQPSAVAQLAQLGQQVGSLEHMGTGLKDAGTAAQNWLNKQNQPVDLHPTPAAPPAVQPPVPDPNAPAPTGYQYARGGLASGGDPEGLYPASGGLDIPDEHSQYHLPQASAPGSTTGPSGLSQIAGLAGTANGLMSLGNGLGGLGSAASSGLGSLLTSLGPMLALKDGGAATDGGLVGENFDFARGGLAAGGLPSDDDAIAAQDALDSAGQFSGGLDPKADLEASHHLQSDAPAPSIEEPHKAEGLTGLRAAKKDLTEQGYFDPQVNPERTNFGGLPDKLPDDHPTAPVTSGLNAADLAASVKDPAAEAPAPDAPLPPRRPADLGLQQVADAAPAPRPGLAPQAETNPVVRAGNAISAGLTGAVEGAGRAVQSGIHAILGHEEGFRPAPYQDGKGGPLAIGYGSHTILDANGNMRPVQPGDRISQPQAQQLLDARLHNEFIPQAQKQIGAAWSNLSQRAQDGIASVTYNYGHVPDNVVAAARSGDDKQIAAAIASLPANPGRRQREAAYVAGQDVYGKDARNFQADAAPAQGGGGNAAPGAAPSGLAGVGASIDGMGKSITDAGQKAGGWFGDNESWLVPLLSGVGTMASSNSRYLGSAILQGLGGGAQAYAQEQTNLANRGQTQAGTANTQADTTRRYQEIVQHGFFKDASGVEYVQRQDGQLMLKGDWLDALAKGRAPPIVGQEKLLASSSPNVSGSGAPAVYNANPAVAAGTTAAPAQPTAASGQPAGGLQTAGPAFAPHPPAPAPTPAQVPSSIGAAGRSMLETKFTNYQHNPDTLAEQQPESALVSREINAAGNAAREQRQSLHNLTKAVMEQPDNGPLAGNVTNAFKSNVVNYLNSWVDGLSLPPDVAAKLKIDPSDADNAAVARKYAGMQQFATAHGFNQNSLGGLEEAARVTPGPDMTKAAALHILSGMYQMQQRSIDRMNYMSNWNNEVARNHSSQARFATNQDAMRAFDADHPITDYTAEKDAFDNVVRNKRNKTTKQPLVSDILAGHAKPEVLDKVGKPGLSRWLTGE